MSQKPLVALMQPRAGYGSPHSGAVEAFLRPTKRGTNRIELKQGTSMLPRCFNLMWANILNLSSRHPITHVAMIHNDVAPDMGEGGTSDWLDVLMDELDRTGADVVSAVVPIKNGHGVTSTAVDVCPDRPWNPRRLTLHETFKLPETFGAEDIPWRQPGQCLLINTGLWVAKWDPAWADPAQPDRKIVFEFRNGIVQTPEGQWAAWDRPEDWLLASELHRQGKKVLTTRKVKLEHENAVFHNRSPWGDWTTDMGWLSCTQAWERAQIIADSRAEAKPLIQAPGPVTPRGEFVREELAARDLAEQMNGRVAKKAVPA